MSHFRETCFQLCPIVQLVASLIADPGVMNSILAQPHTFVEIDHEVFSTAIHLQLVQEGLLSVTSESMCTEYWLAAYSKLAQEKSVVRSTDCLYITIAVDRDVKQQTNQKTKPVFPERFFGVDSQAIFELAQAPRGDRHLILWIGKRRHTS